MMDIGKVDTVKTKLNKGRACHFANVASRTYCT